MQLTQTVERSDAGGDAGPRAPEGLSLSAEAEEWESRPADANVETTREGAHKDASKPSHLPGGNLASPDV
ncbi:hypothetical protein NDU88_010530 [Pleurodeles waltl]|uniref:Uncharacterized protein n=1 Tax=Pleurodeles waltl TaxID=8319 RepID=A0AAV7PVF8_PLEWA|nr:hypothetical protein NDU88_010530 [Pleurodeles waltl]